MGTNIWLLQQETFQQIREVSTLHFKEATIIAKLIAKGLQLSLNATEDKTIRNRERVREQHNFLRKESENLALKTEYNYKSFKIEIIVRNVLIT